jgi:nickel/cobalt exporter
MSVIRVRERVTRQVLIFTAALATMLLAVCIFDCHLTQAVAQGAPFGAPKAAAPAPGTSGGLVAWILAKQAAFYKQFSGLIRAAKADGSAVWSLLAVAFLYGIFHAAGPGHGKAVISSYVVANEETWRRGVTLSFASALLQALVAIAIVAVAAVLLNATAATMRRTTDVIEYISYGLIILIGLRLLWVKGRAFVLTWHKLQQPRGEVGAAVTATQSHLGQGHAGHGHRGHAHSDHDRAGHDHAAHDHAHHDHASHGHTHHDHTHHAHSHDEHASAWGHAHAPEPETLAGPGGWKRGLSAIVAVGLRPCSGAIIVLVFALAQGLFWAGVAATFVMGLGTAITVAVIASIAVGAKAWANRFARSGTGYGTLAMRGIEVGAALLITAFGVLLLMGYMASERLLA